MRQDLRNQDDTKHDGRQSNRMAPLPSHDDARQGKRCPKPRRRANLPRRSRVATPPRTTDATHGVAMPEHDDEATHERLGERRPSGPAGRRPRSAGRQGRRRCAASLCDMPATVSFWEAGPPHAHATPAPQRARSEVDSGPSEAEAAKMQTAKGGKAGPSRTRTQESASAKRGVQGITRGHSIAHSFGSIKCRSSSTDHCDTG